MKKKISVLIAILLCFAMAASFAGCTTTGEEEGSTDEFVAATLNIGESIPVSESEIIAFYNDIMTKVQSDSSYTAENKPGVKTNEAISAGDIKVLAYNAATGEATESDSLSAINKSAKAIKDRIIGGIDTSIPVIAFGDTSTSISTVIYPYDSEAVNLKAEDVISASCSADGNNLNISIVLNNTVETVSNIFGTRDKTAVLSAMNEHCAEYAEINDYTVNYVGDEESNTYSTINLSVELEQQEDGSYVCTGRITALSIRIIADIAANVTMGGSFADKGDVQVQFRLTDEKSYEFDWLGTADWEPVAEDSTEE